MTTRHRTIVVAALAIVFAVSRWQALARTPWDGREARLVLAAGGEAGATGSPLLVGLSRVLHAADVGGFEALQMLAAGAAVLLFPLVFLLARELGFSFVASAAGAALYVVLPNVWLYGGTAHADVPAAALSIAAAALLWRGRTSMPAAATGVVIGVVAALVRWPSAVVLAAPAAAVAGERLVRSERHRRALIAAGAGGGAALAVALAGMFGETLISRTSDALASAAPFFLWPVGDKDLMLPLVALAFIGATSAFASNEGRPGRLAIATFLPLAAVSWLTLDRIDVSRHAIGYLPMHALLAAAGLELLAAPLSAYGIRLHRAAVAVMAAAGIVALGLWVWPALKVQRKKFSPAYASIEWIRMRAPEGSVVFVPLQLDWVARAALRAHDIRVFADPAQTARAATDAFIVDEQPPRPIGRGERRLLLAAPGRPAAASARAVANRASFGRGWYREEEETGHHFRWMGPEGTIFLPAVDRPATLSVVFSVPDAAPKPVHVTAFFNGTQIDTFAVNTRETARQWTLASADAPHNELTLRVGSTVNLAELGLHRDGRVLGLRLEAIEWMPLRR